MAVVFTQIAPPARPSGANGFSIDRRRPCNIFAFTKDAGDTTATLDTLLQWLKEVIVLDADGVTVIAATSTTGSGAPGTFSTALAVLGGGTSGFVICIGNKTTH